MVSVTVTESLRGDANKEQTAFAAHGKHDRDGLGWHHEPAATQDEHNLDWRHDLSGAGHGYTGDGDDDGIYWSEPVISARAGPAQDRQPDNYKGMTKWTGWHRTAYHPVWRGSSKG